MPVVDRGHDHRRSQWSNAFDGGDAPTVRVVLKRNLNPAIRIGDLFVYLRQLLVKGCQTAPYRSP